MNCKEVKEGLQESPPALKEPSEGPDSDFDENFDHESSFYPCPISMAKLAMRAK